jgi:uroporphyrinogen decarboxylase
LEGVVEAIYDFPEQMDELTAIEHRRAVATVERILQAPIKIDFILIGASGLLTLSSPEMFCKYSLPTIREITRLCRQAGMPTMLHSCGKCKFLLEKFVQETDLDCLNPLELSPMGDIDLGEARKIAGLKMSLMGNLHTTNVMLRGTVEQVERESRKAIDDAGKAGGFILSTGDQCGRDTPDANIFAMVRVAKEYGRY